MCTFGVRGVAKNAILAPVDPAAKHGLRLLKLPKKCIICPVFAAILPNSGIPKARLEVLKKENKRCVYMCVFVCMVRFRIFREVKKAETARTHKHPYASYEFVSRSNVENCILNVNLPRFRL